MFPYATDAGSGRHGVDLINTPGLAVEIKARDTVSLDKALKQAAQDDRTGIPLVCWRHNGQGEATMGDWTVTMRLSDFEELWRRATE